MLLRILLVICLSLTAWAQENPDEQERSTLPPVEVPAQFRDAQTVDGPSLGTLRWFEIFQDPQLQELIQTALARNADVRVAMLRVDTARAQLRITGAEEFPRVVGSIGENYQEVSENTPTFVRGFIPRQRSFGEVVLNLLSFELDIWGRLRHQTQAAVAEWIATEEDRRTILGTVVSDVAAGYFNLIELDAEMDVARRTLEARRASLEIVRARQAGGVATLLDVRQAEQLVQQAEIAIPDLQRRTEQAENYLNLLLGRMPGPIERGQGLMEQPVLPVVPVGLPSELLLRRPDIRAAERRIVARQETIEYVRRSYFPRISLTAALGFQSGALSSLFTGNSKVLTLLPSLQFPVFSADQGADVDIAEANEVTARIQYQNTIYTAFREVSDGLIQYQKTREVRERQEELVRTLQDRSRLAYLRYRGGVDTLLAALDADRDLFNGQLAVAQSRRNELLALVSLYKALGGGWQL